MFCLINTNEFEFWRLEVKGAEEKEEKDIKEKVNLEISTKFQNIRPQMAEKKHSETPMGLIDRPTIRHQQTDKVS
jgi:hypothetical protein